MGKEVSAGAVRAIWFWAFKPLFWSSVSHCCTGPGLCSVVPGHNQNQIQCLQPPPCTGEIRVLSGAGTSLGSLVVGSSRGWTPAPGPPVLGGDRTFRKVACLGLNWRPAARLLFSGWVLCPQLETPKGVLSALGWRGRHPGDMGEEPRGRGAPLSSSHTRSPGPWLQSRTLKERPRFSARLTARPHTPHPHPALPGTS